jgi:hypothetical protein
MNQLVATPGATQNADYRSAAFIVQWLHELEECRQGGFLSDEDYAVQRAEKLSELLCEHRYLWLAPVAASGSMAVVAGSVAWINRVDLQMAGALVSLAALFGMVMLARPCRDNLKQAQIRERLQVLNALLAMDLITSDEFLAYEERLHAGSSDLHALGNR